MYNNRLYNTRQSGRFNNTGQFVSGSERNAEPGGSTPLAADDPGGRRGAGASPCHQLQQPPPMPPQPPPPAPPKRPQVQPQSNLQEVPMQREADIDMKTEAQNVEDDKQDSRPAWMKSKLTGVKKISNRERRRRQNQTLRRLLTPKNALMVLNEMLPNEQVVNQFKVEVSQNQYYSKNMYSFCADLTLEGTNYKGFGENKMCARNSAAEQAIRDLIIKKMNKAVAAGEPRGADSAGGSEAGDADGADDEETLPMIQLASFALHKLFTEWECEGHRVPTLRGAAAPAPAAPADAPAAPAPRKPRPAKGAPRALPANAAAMHPCSLLAYMRPQMEYRELAAEGDRPQNMVFTMGVDVDGATYIGKAPNKKEARRVAARAACSALFGVRFDEGGAASAPQLA